MMITGIFLAVFVVSAQATAWQLQHGRYGGPMYVLSIIAAIAVNEGFRRIFTDVRRLGRMRRTLRRWANDQKDVPNDNSRSNQRP